MDFKYKQKVTITLESNSYPDLVRIANKYFLAKPKKKENDPESKRFVGISMTKENLSDSANLLVDKDIQLVENLEKTRLRDFLRG